jgi:hypothetical protein
MRSEKTMTDLGQRMSPRLSSTPVQGSPTPCDTAADKHLNAVMDHRREKDASAWSLITRTFWTDSDRIVIRTLDETGYSAMFQSGSGGAKTPVLSCRQLILRLSRCVERADNGTSREVISRPISVISLLATGMPVSEATSR